MEKFTAEFRTLHGHDRNPLDEIETRVLWISGVRKVELDGYILSPVSTTPSHVAKILELGVYRVLELAGAAIREMNQRSVVGSCLLVRGVFETSCLMYELIHRVEDVVQSTDLAKFRELEEFVTRTRLGHGPKAKTFFLFEEYVSINVLTHIDKLSKRLQAPFDGFYEGLSEYCHPNSHGMIQLYTTKHRACVSHFTERNAGVEHAAVILATNAFATALGMAQDSLERWAPTIDALAVLAEKSIHDNGKWPADIPYPLVRPLNFSVPTESADAS